jgi:hypothetical protein
MRDSLRGLRCNGLLGSVLWRAANTLSSKAKLISIYGLVLNKATSKSTVFETQHPTREVTYLLQRAVVKDFTLPFAVPLMFDAIAL